MVRDAADDSFAEDYFVAGGIGYAECRVVAFEHAETAHHAAEWDYRKHRAP